MATQLVSPAIAKTTDAVPPGHRVLQWSMDNLVWIILLVVLAAFSALVPNFFQTGIFINVIEHSTYVGMLAIGLSFCIIAGEMDLSIESTLGFAAMLSACLTAHQGNMLALGLSGIEALAIVLVLGGIIGLLNGVLIVGLRINSFIVTLAFYIAVRGFGLVLIGGRSTYGLPADFRWISVTSFGGLPLVVLVLIVTFVVFQFLLARTRFGRYVTLIGGSKTAVFRAGVPVSRVIVMVFILSGVLSAFAGWLLAARTNGATPNLGVGLLFDAFAAVVIGGVSLTGGLGSLSGVFAGALTLSAIDTAINIMGIDPYWMNVIRGLLVLVAVLLDSGKTWVRKHYYL